MTDKNRGERENQRGEKDKEKERGNQTEQEKRMICPGRGPPLVSVTAACLHKRQGSQDNSTLNSNEPATFSMLPAVLATEVQWPSLGTSGSH